MPSEVLCYWTSVLCFLAAADPFSPADKKMPNAIFSYNKTILDAHQVLEQGTWPTKKDPGAPSECLHGKCREDEPNLNTWCCLRNTCSIFQRSFLHFVLSSRNFITLFLGISCISFNSGVDPLFKPQ